MFAEPRHVPGVAVASVLVGYPSSVPECPAEAHGAHYLGLGAEDGFHPVVLRLHVVEGERHLVAPNGVGDVGSVYVELEAGEGVSHAGEEAVDVVLVLHDVEVHAYLPVWRRGLVVGACGEVGVVGLAQSYLHHGEILVLEVGPHPRLVLSRRRQSALHGAHEVGLHLDAAPQGYGVVDGFHAQLQLLVLGETLLPRALRALRRGGEGEQQQEATGDSP